MAYRKYESELNMSGLIYPIRLNQISKFEEQNKNISINVMYYEEDTDDVIVLRPRDHDDREHQINLMLLYGQDDRGNVLYHYCLITSLSRLLNSHMLHTTKMYVCNRCLNWFYAEDKLRIHKTYCRKNPSRRACLIEQQATKKQ